MSKVPGARFIEEHGAGANIVLRSRELIDMLDACQAGLGLAVLPCLAAARLPGAAPPDHRGVRPPAG